MLEPPGILWFRARFTLLQWEPTKQNEARELWEFSGYWNKTIWLHSLFSIVDIFVASLVVLLNCITPWYVLRLHDISMSNIIT